jgi:hypothetical protein
MKGRSHQRRNIVATVFLCVLFAPGLTNISQAQTTPEKKSFTESAREKRNALEEEARQRKIRLEEREKQNLEAASARNRKRADCKAKAKEQNLNFINRSRFVKRCLAN